MDQQETSTPEEAVIAQWEQPARAGMLSSGKGTRMLWTIALPVAAILLIVAFWQREVNFGLAAAVILVAVFALKSQERNASLVIAITNLRIVIGKREYPLSDLAGFWLADEGDVIEVNLEGKKPGLLPMTFLYATPSLDEARATLGQALPELEPREKKLNDTLGKYFKL